MKYTGQFRDINDLLYTVEINTPTTGADKELLLSASPFTTEMDTAGETIYAPAKYQAATVGVVTGDYLFDLYQPTAHGASVKLLQGSSVVWTGYISPSLYSQGYTAPLEDLSIDCLDGLATLQYYKYMPMGSAADVHTLKEIITHCVNKAGCYPYVYFPLSIRVAEDHTKDIWRYGYLSEQNFIDDTDDDNAEGATYKDALEQICTFAGVTAYAEGDAVILRDLDYNGDYLKVNVSTGAAEVVAYTRQNYTINGESYAASGATLSLDKVYSKATVTDEFKTFESMLPDFFDGAKNITVTDSGLVMGRQAEYINLGDDAKMLALILSVRPDNDTRGDAIPNMVFIKYYNNPKYIFHKYDASRTDKENLFRNAICYTDTKNLSGAHLVRCVVRRAETLGADPQLTIDDYTADAELTSLDFVDYIFLLNHASAHISDAQAANYPFIEVSPSAVMPAFFGGEKTYLVLSGSVCFHTFDTYAYPIPSGEIDIQRGSTTLPLAQTKLLCRLYWGGLYWNGTEWTATPATFTVPYMKEAKRMDEVMFFDNNFVNTVSWRMGIDGNGYAIPMPTAGALASGQPRLTVYKPYCTGDGASYNDNYFTAIKNFKLSAHYGDPTFSGEQDEDTSYTNVINEDHTEEGDAITFKVCTNDGKKPNYNSVAWKNGDAYKFLGDTYHTSLNVHIADTERYDGSISDGTLRQEETMVYKMVRQYQNPARVLELALTEPLKLNARVYESNLNKTFIIDERRIDFANATYNYKLIEKKLL